MDSRQLVKKSKMLSRVLRHRPESVGLQLDEHGWADVDELLGKVGLTRVELEDIVQRDNKQRFAFGADGKKIRANQGHSIAIDLALQPRDPPPVLYHGTARTSVASILRTGLHSGRRRHVHLSTDVATAFTVGRRHGEPVVLTVDTARMARDGCEFYRAENGVWLTHAVERKYVTLEEGQGK